MIHPPLKRNLNEFHQSTILIVDDHPHNLSVAVDSLADLGTTVLIARSGARGIKRAQYAQPDLILLDILMPEMDGFEVCRQLKCNAITQSIPVFFMTALTTTEEKIKGLQAGAIDYVTKPFDIDELLARITNHLTLRKQFQQLYIQNEKLQQLDVQPLSELPQTNLQQAIAFIQSHLDQGITLESIACEVGMTRFHFCHWFKESMGIAPYQYVIRQRIERAKHLIQQNELNLVDIALQCGFNSQSHLIHHFKKQIGITPNQYKKAIGQDSTIF